MSARTKARKRALDILYSSDMRGTSINQALADAEARAAGESDRRASWLYAQQIVTGVVAHGDEIDEMIQTYSHGWSLERMPAIDRAILRIGAWEVLFNDEVPDAVAIDEAVEAAKQLSTDDSPAFINGMLGTFANTKG
ncbi:transcription antitermination factor NusB [Homoserinimonas sp. OAct 916]|uniref:transcription antitermination factor NusB n=1 Tax=Homoserinimonas sp. OAct 916 TaxID=2211450 RepID=UPI000DBE6DFB|nr:transcription antitermination factor NusB [Homoserinimonas sp. OAct 916]